MIILLGGFLGSGRRVLARKIAKRLGFYYYNIERKKLRAFKFNTNREVRHRTIQPRSDVERRRMYAQVVEEFPLLSKMYPDIVIDDAFHRAGPREYFFSEAKRYFRDMVFVWVDSDEKWVGERFVHMLKKKVIRSIEDARRRRLSAKKRFQPFKDEPITFISGSIADREKDVEDLVQLVRTRYSITSDYTKSLLGS